MTVALVVVGGLVLGALARALVVAAVGRIVTRLIASRPARVAGWEDRPQRAVRDDDRKEAA